MTWHQLAAMMTSMTSAQREQDVFLVEDCGGPEQRVRRVGLATADQDLYEGITVGSVLVLERGEPFLSCQ